MRGEVVSFGVGQGLAKQIRRHERAQQLEMAFAANVDSSEDAVDHTQFVAGADAQVGNTRAGFQNTRARGGAFESPNDSGANSDDTTAALLRLANGCDRGSWYLEGLGKRQSGIDVWVASLA